MAYEDVQTPPLSPITTATSPVEKLQRSSSVRRSRLFRGFKVKDVGTQKAVIAVSGNEDGATATAAAAAKIHSLDGLLAQNVTDKIIVTELPIRKPSLTLKPAQTMDSTSSTDSASTTDSTSTLPSITDSSASDQENGGSSSSDTSSCNSSTTSDSSSFKTIDTENIPLNETKPITKKPSKKPNAKVRFEVSPVACISRPPTYKEHWAMYYWELHIINCTSCKQVVLSVQYPSSPNKNASSLGTKKGTCAKFDKQAMCNEGVKLAQKVKKLQFNGESLEEDSCVAYLVHSSDGSVESSSSSGDEDSKRAAAAAKSTEIISSSKFFGLISKLSQSSNDKKPKVRVELPKNYKYSRTLIKIDLG